MSYRLVRKCTLEDNRDADCVLCCKHIFGPSKTHLNFYNPGVTRAKIRLSQLKTIFTIAIPISIVIWYHSDTVGIICNDIWEQVF